MRVALYARYSTDKQDEISLDVQLAHCRAEIKKLGWTETHCFTDQAQSAATLHRPGMQSLISIAKSGQVDVVYADAMDRLSRSQGDIATLFEQLRFRNVQLVTRAEGPLNALLVGLKGTMNADALTVISTKTRDALRHRFQMGQNPGGIAYGYRTKIEHDVRGERIRGLVEIDPAQAQIVIRILEEYVAGRSPDAIAKQLNREGIPAPRSGKRDKKPGVMPAMWVANTITGNVQRGTGLLNNIRYIGLRPFEKQQFRKNPETGRRHSFVNPADQQQQPISVPELRIVSDELWQAVKARQEKLSSGPRSTIQKAAARPFWEQQRPRYLLSGKMTCGECGSAFAKGGKHRFRCQGSAKKGEAFCTNRFSVRQDVLDRRILAGLQNELMQTEVLDAFQEEYAVELVKLRKRSDRLRPDHEREHAEVTEKLKMLKSAIMKGVDPTMFVEELNQLQARKQTLEGQLAISDDDIHIGEIVMQPDLAGLYHSKIEALTDAFEDEALRAEAFEKIRELIAGVVFVPEGDELGIYLRGELVSILELCACSDTKKPPAGSPEEALQIKLVAGVGFEPTTFRL